MEDANAHACLCVRLFLVPALVLLPLACRALLIGPQRARAGSTKLSMTASALWFAAMVWESGYSRETGTTGRTGIRSFDKRHMLFGPAHSSLMAKR